jgi:glycosyltransferase involved in cell wall biosynthesis
MDEWHVRVPRVRGDPPVVAVSFHWDGPAFPETKTSFPHFQPALPALKQSFKVIGHGHPRIMNYLAAEYRRLGIEVVRDFGDVLKRADVYCTDNSSTLFEFASTGRPVVVMNAPWYRRDVRHGLRFWDCADVGIQVDRPEDLVSAVVRALEDPSEQQVLRRAAVDKVYGVHDGTAAKHAAEAILQTLEKRGIIQNYPVSNEAMVEMVALKSFLGPEGMLRRDDKFQVGGKLGKALEERRLAVITKW